MTIEEAKQVVVDAIQSGLQGNSRVQYLEVMESDGELFLHGEFWDEDGEQEVYASLMVELI